MGATKQQWFTYLGFGGVISGRRGAVLCGGTATQAGCGCHISDNCPPCPEEMVMCACVGVASHAALRGG